MYSFLPRKCKVNIFDLGRESQEEKEVHHQEEDGGFGVDRANTIVKCCGMRSPAIVLLLDTLIAGCTDQLSIVCV